MLNHGDKFLLGFLGLGIVIYLLSMSYGEDAPTDPHGDSSSADKDTSTVPALTDTRPMIGEVSLAQYSLQAETATHWKLPGRLEEISGLAMTSNNRVLAHDDENAVIYEIDYRKGSILKSFALADMAKPIADDFEGIALVEDLIYLVTSSGRLYECREGDAGESVLFTIYSTGVGRSCEIEGLAYDASQRMLLLMCKNPRTKALRDTLILYRWSIDTKELGDGAAHTLIPTTEFSRHIKGKKFHPSGIERHPLSGNYFIVAARQRAIAEITPSGQVLALRQFSAQWHRQIEGITFAADNTLIVADEGAGKKSRLTLYPVSGN